MCPTGNCAPVIQIRAIRTPKRRLWRADFVIMPLRSPGRVRPHARGDTTNRPQRVSLLIRCACYQLLLPQNAVGTHQDVPHSGGRWASVHVRLRLEVQ
jgi:hypothetical protein